MKKILYFISTFLALTLPIGAVAFSYVIQPGDTLSKLAAKNSISVQELADANNIQNPDHIFAGKTLEIPDGELVGGSGGTYTPVTGYQSRLSVFLSASASTINVASTKDPAGNQISISDVSSSSSARIYLNIAPGTSKEEIIYCTGVTATAWTGCVRGLSFQGGSMSASTTLAFAHNAGSAIVISNVGQFYTEYVSRTGNQDVYDIKTFYSYPKFAVTTTVPVLASEFATKYYVDNVGAGGFTAANVSTTRGLSVDGSVPERVGINASSTGGINFASDGSVQVDTTDNFSFTGNVTSSKLQVSATPYGELGAVSKTYLDQQVTWGAVTGTAGMALAANDALFVSSTGTLFKTNSNAASSTYQFVGFSTAAYSVNDTVTIATPGGNICAFSGLSTGYNYYLNGALGQVSTTSGTFLARVGRAVSSSCIAIVNPKFIRTGLTTLPASAGSTFVETGFYPAFVNIVAIAPGAGGGQIAFGDDTNTSFYGATTTNGGWNQESAFAWHVINNNAGTIQDVSKGTITSKGATGFIFNQTYNIGGGQTIPIKWTAWSE